MEENEIKIKDSMFKHLIISLYFYQDKLNIFRSRLNINEDNFFHCYTNYRKTYKDMNDISSKILLRQQELRRFGYTDKSTRAYKRDYRIR
jgi:hypothetical protein